MSGTDQFVPSKATELLDDLAIARKYLVLNAQGVVAETFDRAAIIGFTSPGGGAFVGGMVGLIASVPVSGAFVILAGTALASNCWVAMFRTADNTRLAISADNPSMMAAAGRRFAFFTATYVPTVNDTVYVGLLSIATAPTIGRGNNSVAQMYQALGSGKDSFVSQSGLSALASTLNPTSTAYAIYAGVF